MSKYKNWLLAQDGHIATLTLNRPEAKNSLNSETLFELRDITAHLRTQNSVWVVVLQGQGKHFSIGMDVNMIKDRLEQPAQANRELLLREQGCLDEFEALEKPTIAKLHGFCIGGGLILALCCDFRIASERAVFSLPEVKLGIPIMMGTQRLTRVVGTAAAKELILLGQRFDAKAAQACGLLNQVAHPEKLDAAVAALADRFQNLPPRSVGVAKRIIDSGFHLPMRDSQDLELAALTDLLGNRDVREAIASYTEKRPPRFTGE